jgi:Domain of unknown function (DUF4157)
VSLALKQIGKSKKPKMQTSVKFPHQLFRQPGNIKRDNRLKSYAPKTSFSLETVAIQSKPKISGHEEKDKLDTERITEQALSAVPVIEEPQRDEVTNHELNCASQDRLSFFSATDERAYWMINDHTKRIGNTRPELKVSEPSESHEREAHDIAKQVLQITDSYDDHFNINYEENKIRQESLAHKLTAGKFARQPANSTSNLEVSEEIVHQINNKSGGKPLDNSIRSFMESRFNFNFSDVRIHDDVRSHQLAKAINARAFTRGNDIFLGNNEFSSDKHLIAHELTHIIQEKNGNHNVIYRDILTYQLPRTKEEMGHWYHFYSPDSVIIKLALYSLTTNGKVAYSDRGTETKFFNITASKAEISSALKTSGIVNSNELADAIMDNHKEYIYASQVSTLSTGRILYFIKIEDWTTRKNVIEEQHERHLTNYEKSEAKIVFGNNLNYDKIIIDDTALVMTIGSYARTTPWTINFPYGSYGKSGFMPWLIHELTHSWQYEHGYAMAKLAFHGTFSTYDYGGYAGLVNANKNGKKLRDFNTEQQGEIAQDYYIRLKAGSDVSPWVPYIKEFQTK